MGKSLADYAAANPMPEPPEREEMAAKAKTMQERQQERERAEQLKQSIIKQLEQGNDPQIILYTALECIGLYTNDPEYITAGQSMLDKVYADLAQQSFLQDNAAIAAERLEAQQAEYNKHLRNSINRQLSGYHRIEKALNDALTALNDMEEPPILSD